MSRLKIVRGMKDILPTDANRWHQVEAAAARVFEGYGYHEMRPPVVEHTELFQRSIGEATDIIEKEMYTFTDRGGRSLSLRPEATASCVRATIEHGLLATQPALRIWYAGPMFRYERQQKERYRQFYQLGAEIYGVEHPCADVEIILITARLWKVLGLGTVQLDVNSLGTRQEQATYRDQLVQYLRDHREQLDEDSVRRLELNPLRVLDSKNPALQSLIERAPAPIDHLGEGSSEHFAQVQSMLAAAGVECRVNRRLVRGLDYYTRTVFEWLSGDLGAQSAICGGGRYDQLFRDVGGGDTPAIGFSAGIERIVAVMDARSVAVPDEPLHFYLVAVGAQAAARAHAIAEKVRDAAPTCRLLVDATDGSFRAKLKRADRSGALFALLIGDDEAAANTVRIKALRENGEQELAADDLAARAPAIMAGSLNLGASASAVLPR